MTEKVVVGGGDSKNNNDNKLRICDYNKWDKYDAGKLF